MDINMTGNPPPEQPRPNLEDPMTTTINHGDVIALRQLVDEVIDEQFGDDPENGLARLDADNASTLDRVQHLISQLRLMTDLVPAHRPDVYVTFDGDTHWLECFAQDPDGEQGHTIRTVEAGDTWQDIVDAVDAHECPEATR